MFGIMRLSGIAGSMLSTGLDIIANNISNSNTNGYKPAKALSKSFDTVMFEAASGQKELPYGAAVDSLYTDYTQGDIRVTSNPFDLALNGKGFFVVSTPQGERYTRNGSFFLDAQNRLVDANGYPVLGLNGEIILDPTKDFLVTKSGAVLQDGQVVDSVRIVDFVEPYPLERVGNNLFSSSQGPIAAQGTEVKQGAVETSGVNGVQEMVNMIALQRMFEANANIIRITDSLLGKVISDVPNV